MERRNTERRNEGTRNNKEKVNISHKIKGMHIFVEFISSEDFKEKRDCPSDLLAPIETMKRTKLKQVKKAVDKKKP